jgi:hypothetical protein
LAEFVFQMSILNAMETSRVPVRRYRAPQLNGELLSVPSLAETSGRLAGLFHAEEAIRPLIAEVNFARGEVLALAKAYTARLDAMSGLESATSEVPSEPEIIVATGHQPEWFHPGVLAKNIAADALVKKLRDNGRSAVALNLIVDSDELAATSISVPIGTRLEPRRENVPFDQKRGEVPWEELRAPDLGLFAELPARLEAVLSPWGYQPVMSSLTMPMGSGDGQSADLGGTQRLCDLVAAVRHQWERLEGMANLEIPLSWVAGTVSFRRFVMDWLRNAAGYREQYNRVVQAYRDENGIKGQQRPVPDLLVEPPLSDTPLSDAGLSHAGTGDVVGRVEVPFWAWVSPASAEVATDRERLFVRAVDGELELSTSSQILGRIPSGIEEEESAIEELGRWFERGVKIRSRALMTTMFSRLYLCDLFIHGIGGAIYDEMTDALIEVLYERPAPEFLTVSATLQLPLGGSFSATPADVRRHEGLLRDLRQNPWRHLPPCDELSTRQSLAHADLCRRLTALHRERERLLIEQRIAEKRADRQFPRRVRRQRNRERYLRLEQIRNELLAIVEPQVIQVREDLETLTKEVAANKVLKSREFAWCLFPAAALDELVTKIRSEVG